MKIGVLTSSRADYGIYLPLLQALHADHDTELEIIAFGTHVSPYHGHTIDAIREDGFNIAREISSLLLPDRPQDIAESHGITVQKFASFWEDKKNNYDMVFTLGDRFEMNAAVLAGIPFNISFAHIHGGETTLGAIDNIYRHQITLASKLHFPSTKAYADRIIELTRRNEHVHPVGSLSLDKLRDIQWMSRSDFCKGYGLNDQKPFALVTIHPETVAFTRNEEYMTNTMDAIEASGPDFQWVVTMPNADTAGSVIREYWQKLKNRSAGNLFLIENFGAENYFQAMKHASFMMGNSSSGIIEGGSLGKYVINLGNRQQGREAGENVYHVPFQTKAIKHAITEVQNKGDFTGVNPYDMGGATKKITQHLKEYVAHG